MPHIEYPPGEGGEDHELNLEEFTSFRDLKNAHEVVDFMLADENFTIGYKIFRDIAQMIADEPDSWFDMDWKEVEMELRTLDDIPVDAILFQGLMSVFKVAGNRMKKKGGNKKKGNERGTDFPPYPDEPYF
jgi:hypothetical protein